MKGQRGANLNLTRKAKAKKIALSGRGGHFILKDCLSYGSRARDRDLTWERHPKFDWQKMSKVTAGVPQLGHFKLVSWFIFADINQDWELTEHISDEGAFFVHIVGIVREN